MRSMKWKMLGAGIMAAILLVAGDSEAKMDPLGVITERLVRAEVLLVLDTSGSMAWHPSPSYAGGSDCQGKREGSVDLCGDGMCTGAEGTTWSECTSDCPATSATSAQPGDTPMCSVTYPYISRMFQIKRVLGNLLPDMRRTASFGLVTFNQSGYFRYYRGSTATTRQVTIYLSKMEMEQLGAWSEANNRPNTTFTRDGTSYTLLSSTSFSVDKDSLYARTDDVSVENRFRFSTAGRLYSDGRHSWRFKGSYYTYTQAQPDFSVVKIAAKYHGPQFADADGNTWVYHRYDGKYTSQGIVASNAGLVVEKLAANGTQVEQDAALYRILARLNSAKNGGLWSYGGTPTSAAVEVATQHFVDRKLGTGPFSGEGPDPSASCRPRYVLLLTDGQPSYGYDPAEAVAALYNNTEFTGNPVRTLVVGLPGLPSSALSALDRAADMGDDGLANGSASAMVASDETTLLRVIQETLFDMVRGDYTTTPPGTTTSYGSLVADDIGLVGSTEYPGWKGHFKALDFTETPPVELWNAGTKLMLTEYNKREIFTGYPSTNGKEPVPLFSDSGDINYDGGCGGCGPAGIKQVWDEVGNPPTRHEIEQVVQWLAGKGKAWKLAPIFRSVPASVGPPPSRDIKGHHLFQRKHAGRERLVYVTSNDGVLHAFRVTDGSEAFAYVPPNLLPALYKLWQQAGQDTDPGNFKWLLASSPRVEDMPPGSGATDWSTQLVLTMGPGGEEFVVLDITDPSTCYGADCVINDPPFKLVSHSRSMRTSSSLGQTWSTPAMFYNFPVETQADGTTAEVARGRLAMGSGYGVGVEGDYYNYYRSVFEQPSAAQHSRTGAAVDFAVLADTAVATDPDNRRTATATYQADLAGKIVRYDKGQTLISSTLLDAGTSNPFYYSPAVQYLAGGKVLVAAASLAHDETNTPSGAEATLYLRLDNQGMADATQFRLNCKVSEICSGKEGCPTVESTTTCNAPSSRARPVDGPVLAYNELDADTGQYEAYYLVYDPPTVACTQGSSWLIRVVAEGAEQRLLQAIEYKNSRATGVALAGGGLDLAISQIGTNGAAATAFTITGNVRAGSLGGLAPYVETWREVR